MTGGHQLSSMDAARILHARRKDHDIVVSAMGAARDWMTLAPHPRDWVFVPSSMGQATALGLGLALARPDLRVLVLGGDGGLIMNLGSLITISGQQPANLILLIFDNGVYEVTGGQPTPASDSTRRSSRLTARFASASLKPVGPVAPSGGWPGSTTIRRPASGLSRLTAGGRLISSIRSFCCHRVRNPHTGWARVNVIVTSSSAG